MAPKATPSPQFQGNWAPNRNYTNNSQPGNQVKLNSAGTSNRREFPNQSRQLYGDNRPQKRDAAASGDTTKGHLRGIITNIIVSRHTKGIVIINTLFKLYIPKGRVLITFQKKVI